MGDGGVQANLSALFHKLSPNRVEDSYLSFIPFGNKALIQTPFCI